jgi:hypothetical protein
MVKIEIITPGAAVTVLRNGERLQVHENNLSIMMKSALLKLLVAMLLIVLMNWK